MSIGQELEELKIQIERILQQQNTILQKLQKSELKELETTLEMVSKPYTPKPIEIVRDNRWK